MGVLMQKTRKLVTLPKYAAGHNLETAQEVPPFVLGETTQMEEPGTKFQSVEPTHPAQWLNLARNYGMSKLDEFGGKHCKYEVHWPDGSKNWVTVDAGGWEKVW
jgi:hypothetical protein